MAGLMPSSSVAAGLAVRTRCATTADTAGPAAAAAIVNTVGALERSCDTPSVHRAATTPIVEPP